MEKCFMCKGDMEERRTAYMVELDNCIVVIKMSLHLCVGNAAKKAYTDEVACVLEEIINKAKELLTEIAVINYPAA